MHHKHLSSYLRTFRKHLGLTQKEMAHLLGLKSSNHVSRFERLLRLPSAEGLIALMIIFKKSPEELIPAVYDKVLKLIHLRATELHEELQGDGRQITKAKLDALESVFISDDSDKPTNL